jgi:exodeoxyribonuclease VII large subunit
MSNERQIFTLKQVVSSIRKTLEARYHQTYWIKAEMHKLNTYPSGHAFPELVEKRDNKIVAQMTATIWKDSLNRINKKFAETIKEPLTEGLTLLMQVKVVFNELHGLSLQILDIDPSFTLGELQKEREETLKRLQNEGILNANQKLQFPLLPQRIAIISAESSKGLSDFNKVLLENPWNYSFFTMLFPAYLQGDIAVSSIKAELEKIRRVIHHFDVVVIVRGGGGEVGMSCYNHFELCKSIASFPIPVLTGIGHSTNLTVAEMIAFRNAITPTELADFLLQSFYDFSVPVHESAQKIALFTKRLIEQTRVNFQAEMKHFRSTAELFLTRSRHHLTSRSQQFRFEARAVIFGSHERINSIKKSLSTAAETRFKSEEKLLNDLHNTLPSLKENKLKQEHREIERIQDLVRVLDPINVLRRGYAIARFKDLTIKEKRLPNIGDEIEIETEKNILTSTIQLIHTKGS